MRLGERIITERSRRWRTREDFAKATGLSTRLLSDLETGRRSRYQPATLATVEAALGWSPGTCERLAQGGRVRREADPHLTRLLDVWPRLGVEARILLANLAEAVLQQRP